MTASKSQYHLYALGNSAENKPRDTNLLKVFPTEKTPFVEGELNAETKILTAKGTDKDGNAYEISVPSKTYITAEWLRGDSNRFNAPDVQRADQIILFRYGDTDRFFWQALGSDEDLDRRRLETVTVVLSNRRKALDTPLTDDERWVIEASTHDKHITIKTTKSDGEPFAYLIQLNLTDGQYIVTDDVGNQMHINSAENEVLLQNADHSFVQVIKNIINIKSADEVNIDTAKYTLKASDSSTVTTPTATYDTDTTTINASGNVDINTPTTAISANATVGGTLGVTGGTTLGGGGVTSGGMKITGGLEVDDKDVGSTHTHANGGSGPPN